jgi:protoporphyrinogen oxidase
MMGRRVLVLGGGVCGLAAAWRLLEQDPTRQVTILEREERPGGLARSLTVEGMVADMGPHRIFTELPDVQEFLNDLAGDQLETVRRHSLMWLKGGWVEYPPKPAEMIARLGLGRLGRAGASYVAHKAAALVGADRAREESFESLMIDAFGPELYNLLVGPYAEKVWKMPGAEIHADIARVRVSAGGLDQMVKKLILPEGKGPITAVKKFYYIAGGVERLVHKLRAGVEQRGGRIQLIREVVGIRDYRTGHAEVTATARDTGAREVHQAEEVISTIPVADLLGMLLERSPDGAVASARAGLRTLSNFLVCLAIDRPRVTEAQWLYFPGRDTVFNRGYEPRNFHSSMAPDGRTLLVLEITAHPGDETDRRSDAALLEATLRGLERIGLVERREVIGSLVHRIPQTYPIYDLDYRDRMATICRYLTRFPRIISCGRQGLFLHNNMDHSIHMGFRAAHCVLNEPDPAAAFYAELRRFQQFRIVD